MKRLLRFFLCALLVISMALPALAETPVAEAPAFTIGRPVSAADYQAWFATWVTTLTGQDVDVTWVEFEEGLHMAQFDGSPVGIGYRQVGEDVDEVMFVCTGALDDQMAQVVQVLFLYVACPFVDPQGTNVEAAVTTVAEGLLQPFYDGTIINQQVEFGGVPAIVLAQVNEDGTYSFQFVLDCIPKVAEAAQ